MTRSTGGSRKRNGFRSLLRLARAGVVERDDVHFPNRLFQQGLGNDSDVPRIFVLNLACASAEDAQVKNLIFDAEDFEGHQEAAILLRTKEVVLSSLNGLLLDLWRFKLVHLQ